SVQALTSTASRCMYARSGADNAVASARLAATSRSFSTCSLRRSGRLSRAWINSLTASRSSRSAPESCRAPQGQVDATEGGAVLFDLVGHGQQRDLASILVAEQSAAVERGLRLVVGEGIGGCSHR